MLGKNIKYLRQKKGLTQKQLSIQSNVSLATLCEIEKGKRKNPTISVLIKLSDALEISIDDIVRYNFIDNVPVTGTK